MTPTRASLLLAPLAVTALTPEEAEACAYYGDPCEGAEAWSVLTPYNAAQIPIDGVLVLTGVHHGGEDADSLATIDLTVTKDGQPIAGALEATSTRGVLVWRPAEPWAVGMHVLEGMITNPNPNPKGYSYGMCAEEVVPVNGALMIDDVQTEALAPPTFEVESKLSLVSSGGLDDLACCEGAGPTIGYGCGQYYDWDPTQCTSTKGTGFLSLTIDVAPAAADPTGMAVLYTLKVNGVVQLSGLAPEFGPFNITEPACLEVEATSLATGETTNSGQQCFGEDIADKLGPQPIDPSETLDCPMIQQCEAGPGGWDMTMCHPFHPPPPGPTSSDTNSDTGSDESDTGGQDGEKGCACAASGAPGPAGLGLAGLVLLAGRRRRDDR